jgi:nucleoside-diphosphate-sugar epimerase
VGTLAVAQRLLNGGWIVLGVSGQPGLSGERFRWIEADLLQLAAVAQISQTASPLDAIISAAGSSAPRRSGRSITASAARCGSSTSMGLRGWWTHWSRGWSTVVASW